MASYSIMEMQEFIESTADEASRRFGQIRPTEKGDNDMEKVTASLNPGLYRAND